MKTFSCTFQMYSDPTKIGVFGRNIYIFCGERKLLVPDPVLACLPVHLVALIPFQSH